jgi:hypothetical protein
VVGLEQQQVIARAARNRIELNEEYFIIKEKTSRPTSTTSPDKLCDDFGCVFSAYNNLCGCSRTFFVPSSYTGFSR